MDVRPFRAELRFFVMLRIVFHSRGVTTTCSYLESYYLYVRVFQRIGVRVFQRMIAVLVRVLHAA